jgi:long-chain fatty acid transport protein
MKVSKVEWMMAAAMGAAVVATSGEALAAGFQLREQSTDYIGNAFAGSAAQASSPATIWYNPAGMTLLHGHQIAGSLTWIAPQARFTGTGRSALGLPTPANTGGDAIDDAAVGATFAMYDWSKDLKFGVAVVSPFGLRSNYLGDWAGKYFGNASAVTTINVNPNVAYRISPNLSVGFGLSAEWFEADLSGSVDQMAICFANPALPGCPTAADGLLRVKGDNIGIGFNAGLMWEFSPQTRIGLAYRSEIHHDLKGDVTTIGMPAALYRPSGPIHAGFTSPPTATASFYHEFDDKWAVVGDVQWTGWSRFKDLNVYYDANGSLVTGTHEGWRDTWFFALGANYKWKPGHTIRVGAAYDMGAVTEASLRTPRIPDTDRVWLSAGYTWDFDEHLRMSFGYAHIFAKKADVALTGVGLSSLTGSYDGSVDLFSTSFTYKF